MAGVNLLEAMPSPGAMSPGAGSRSPSARPRAADAGVKTAVEQMQKHQKFRRMMVFGLRSLSDLTMATGTRFKENALAALDMDAVESISAAVQNDPSDEECAGLCCNILWAMVEALQDPSPGREAKVAKFVSSGGVSALIAVIKGLTKKSDLDLEKPLLALKNVSSLGALPTPGPAVDALIGALDVSTKSQQSVVETLAHIATLNTAAAEYLAQSPTAIPALLKAVAAAQGPNSACKASSPEATVAASLKCVQRAAATGIRLSEEALPLTMVLLDDYRNSASVCQVGSGAMARLVGPEQLQKCLDQLSSAADGSAERKKALSLLASLSYVGSYASVIVQNKSALATLCDAVKRASADVQKSPSDTSASTGFAGVCKMLATCASDPNHLPLVKVAAPNLCAATAAVAGSPIALSACCSTLAAMCADVEIAKSASAALPVVIKALEVPNVDSAVAESGSSLISAIASHGTPTEALIAGQPLLLQVLPKVMAGQPTNAALWEHGVGALAQAVKHCGNASSSRAALETVVSSVEKYKGINSVSENAALFFANLVKLSGCDQLVKGSALVSSTLTLLLAAKSGAAKQRCLETLEVAATEQDVMQALSGLEAALKAGRVQPEKALKALAAVAGLSQIRRLGAAFERQNVAGAITAGLDSWVKEGSFKQQKELITAGTVSLAQLAGATAGPLNTLISSLLASMLAPNLRRLVEKQEIIENSALDVIRAAEALAALQRIEAGEAISVSEIVDGVVKVMRKWPDNRHIHVSCLNVLCELASLSGGPGVLAEAGALKHVLAYMQKVTMYEDVQTAGFRLMNICLSAQPDVAEMMKRNGALDVIKKVSRTHGKSPSVRQYLLPVAAILMPEDELESQIAENLRIIRGTPTSDYPTACLDNLKALTQLTVSAPGVRCAVRLGAAGVYTNLITQSGVVRKKKSMNPSAELLAETTFAMKNLVEIRGGCVALVQANGVDAALTAIDELELCSASQAKRDGLLNAAYVLRTIMGNERLEAGEIAFKKGARDRLAKIMLDAQADEDLELFGATTGAMVAMRSPGFRKSPDFAKFVGQIVEGIDSTSIRPACLQALEDLLDRPDPATLDILAKNKCVHALLKALDDFCDDPRIRQRALHCLDEITRHKNAIDAFRKGDATAALATVLNVKKKTLKRCKQSPDEAAVAIQVLTRLAQPKDAEGIRGSGILDIVNELLDLHPEHAPLRLAVGGLISMLGPDEILADIFKQIIDTVKQKPADFDRRLKDLCGRAAVYLSADVRDPMKALALAPAAMNALADAINGMSPDKQVESAAAAAAVSRKLMEKYGYSDDLSPRIGAGAVQPKLLPTLARLMGDCELNSRPCRNKRLVCDTYKALADCLRNPWSRSAALEMGQTKKLVRRAEDLLKAYSNDPETTARLLDFLAAMAADKKGVDEVLAQSVSSSKKNRSPAASLIADTMAIINRHRKHNAVVDSGTELQANLLKFLDPLPSDVVANELLRDLNAVADGSPENLTASLRVQGRCIGKMSADDASMELKKLLAKIGKSREDPTLNAMQHAMVASAAARMLGELADLNKFDELKKANAADIMVGLLDDATVTAAKGGDGAVSAVEGEGMQDPLFASRAVFRNMRKLAKDGDIGAKLTRGCAATLLGTTASLLASSPMDLSEMAKALTVFAESGEGNGRLIGSTTGFKNFLDQLNLMATKAPQKTADELRSDAAKLLKAVQDDTPEVLTLESVHGKWTLRVEKGESMNLNEATAILPHVDFVMNYTEEYSKEAHKQNETTVKREFMFGCKCLRILHLEAENAANCIEKKEPSFILKAIKRQKNDQVCQWACEVAADALQFEPMVKAFIAEPESALIVADAALRGRQISNVSTEEAQEMLIPRLLLIERMATQRAFFNNTDAMLALIGAWDDFDKGKYDSLLLRHVFRAMRQIVNDHFVPIIMKNDVPRRLIEVVDNKETDMELLPDVLFLLGTLAVVPQIKTIIGELKGVEACLDLIRRCLKMPNTDTNRVQTNGCLALANMTIGHGVNINRFTAAKGQELNVEVMRNSMDRGMVYDVANGASILMCNTCFRRDDQKELYGKKGAPEAVMHTIKRYDGREDNSAIRCLNSMFKAIGNLALYTPNVDVFLAHELEQTLIHFYTKSANLPDSLIETSLRTVSNLVMENTESAMKRFGKLVVPLVQMLQQGNRTTMSMLAMSFETLGCLCRLPENARIFESNRGIPTVLKILNSECDESLYASGVFVLGIQSTNPHSVGSLMEHGVFNFLVSLFDQQLSKPREANSGDDDASDDGGSMTTDLVVSALRCVRRLTITPDAVMEFVNAGGITALVQISSRTEDHSMIHLEVYRNVIAFLAQFPPPQIKSSPVSTAASDGNDWDAEVADEGILPAYVLAEKLPGPRSWEILGLSVEQMSTLTGGICQVLAKEENAKQQRLAQMGLGLLAYFSGERVEPLVGTFYSCNFTKPIEILICSFESNELITYICCYILSNIAFCSDSATYALLRREKKLRSNLDYAVKALQRADRQLRDYCTITSKLINEKSLDPARFAVQQYVPFDLESTAYNKDPYPNGVQDLPLDMREEIRAGGKFKMVIDEKNRETFHWRASFDMLALQWRIDPKEGPHTHVLPIVRLKTIAKGTSLNGEFQRIAARTNPVHRINDGTCCYLGAAAAQDHPDGVDLRIFCGTRKSRDRFVALLTEWRDAAAYGF